ncbi:MAG: aminotransferase class III-fold pyridoxal phosphate-dependent enzyme, partial [Phycisphaeraceae bacterium]
MSETTTPTTTARTEHLARLDQQHVWHPFTPMRQWRQTTPTIIERGEGPYIIDTDGNRLIDGAASIWCNVHGHRVPEIDNAIRNQLDKIAHSTLLGLASPPSIELAAMLARRAPGTLNKVFYSDAGATALELAFKMAVGYWYHRGQPDKHKFIGLHEAYHGDTVGTMSVGYSEGFHRPFLPLVFNVTSFAHPDPVRPPQPVRSDAAPPRIPPPDYTQGHWPS